MTEQNMPKIGFIGAGTTGTALAVRLAQHGYPVTAVSSRSLTSAEKLAARIRGCIAYSHAQEVADTTGLVLITTPDDVISVVAGEIRWRGGQSIVHCSGAHSVDILKAAKQFGATTGCFHPLQTFASVEHAIDNIPGSTFAIEAEEPLVSLLKKAAVDLEGDWVILKAGDKVLYHAAAVIACNYLVTLVKLSTDLWQTFDVPPTRAVKALMPLLQGTLSNIKNVGLPNCLTGPIARGDLGTISRHLESLSKQAPSVLDIYKELGLQTIPIALAKGKIDSERAAELEALFR
jgi:predicted short-subunit dehydrogenase-like oxidoreductase (DUF2520 family)